MAALALPSPGTWTWVGGRLSVEGQGHTLLLLMPPCFLLPLAGGAPARRVRRKTPGAWLSEGLGGNSDSIPPGMMWDLSEASAHI